MDRGGARGNGYPTTSGAKVTGVRVHPIRTPHTRTTQVHTRRPHWHAHATQMYAIHTPYAHTRHTHTHAYYTARTHVRDTRTPHIHTPHTRTHATCTPHARKPHAALPFSLPFRITIEQSTVITHTLLKFLRGLLISPFSTSSENISHRLVALDHGLCTLQLRIRHQLATTAT